MKKSLIVSIGLVIVLVGGYFVVQNQLPKKPQTTEKLTVAMVDNPVFAFIHIAKSNGYFKEEGLDVIYDKNCIKGIACMTEALKGNSDIGISYETPAIIKIYEGEKLRIISTLHTSTKNIAIVARKDKGISTINDFKGKKIGVTKNSSYEFFLQSYLLSQGIKLSDITIVDGEFTSMLPWLKEGKVDAVAVGNPFFYEIEKEFPQESITIFQSEVYTEDSVMAGREDIIKNKKEAITRFLKALVKAENFYKTNNQKSLDIVIAELPAFSEESIRGTWDKFTPVLKLDNVLLTLLNREGQWFKDNGAYTTEVPDFRKAIFTDYLKSVKPEAVTVF